MTNKTTRKPPQRTRKEGTKTKKGEKRQKTKKNKTGKQQEQNKKTQTKNLNFFFFNTIHVRIKYIKI